MMKSHNINSVLLLAGVAVAIFAGLAVFVPLDELVILFNGVFVGAMTAVAVAYWRLVWNSLMGVSPYDRVEQMTLGFFFCWVAYCIAVSGSIYYHSAGIASNATFMTALSRYVAIIAAILQVSAPDFGLGIFHGRDRKTLWLGTSLGLIIGLLVIWLQRSEALS
jgi:hypothetical protein